MRLPFWMAAPGSSPGWPPLGSGTGDSAVALRWLRGGPAVTRGVILDQVCFWMTKPWFLLHFLSIATSGLSKPMVFHSISSLLHLPGDFCCECIRWSHGEPQPPTSRSPRAPQRVQRALKERSKSAQRAIKGRPRAPGAPKGKGNAVTFAC
jgi:hypothetical protein